jgi:hypothetical protein
MDEASMALVTITVKLEHGLVTVVDAAAPPGVTVRVEIRDYDTDGSDPNDLDADESGRACIVSATEHSDLGKDPGFI